MNISKRARKAGFAVGLAAVATMAFGVSSASAAPQPFATLLDNGFLKTTFPGTGFDVLEPSTPAGGTDPPASLAGTIDFAAGGQVVIPAGCTPPANPGVANGTGFCFPDFSGTVSGIPISVALDTTENMVATPDGFPAVTGGVTVQPTDFLAVLNVAGDICTIGDPTQDGMVPDATPDMTLTFNTTDRAFPEPYDGDLFDVPFPTPPAYPPLQNGAIAAAWPSLPAAVPDPGDDCTLVNSLISGPGGFWIAQGLTAPAFNGPPPGPPVVVGGGIVTQPTPAKKCKKGQKKKKGKCVKKKKKKKKKK